MDEQEDLFEAVHEALKEKGVLDKLSCQVRAQVLQIFKDHLVIKDKTTVTQASGPESPNFVINELIKEYLDFNGYKNTSDVLSVESGQPLKRANRNDLEAVLNVHSGPNAKQVPLLYSIVSNLRRQQ